MSVIKNVFKDKVKRLSVLYQDWGEWGREVAITPYAIIVMLLNHSVLQLLSYAIEDVPKMMATMTQILAGNASCQPVQISDSQFGAYSTPRGQVGGSYLTNFTQILSDSASREQAGPQNTPRSQLVGESHRVDFSAEGVVPLNIVSPDASELSMSTLRGSATASSMNMKDDSGDKVPIYVL